MRSQEDIKFDKEWFLADQFEPPAELDEILAYKLPSTLGDPLSAEEQTQLRNLGNRECITPRDADLVLIDNQKDIYLNLPPLLFAILYDKFTTLGSSTPESPWTISHLSPSLSPLSPLYLPPNTLSPFSSNPPLKQIKLALFRRILTYPLYRHLPLAEKCWKDAAAVIAMGKRAVLRVLWDAREIFLEGDWSVFNRIFWEDFLVWVQTCRESVLGVLARGMDRIEIKFGEIGFGLEDFEVGE
jgi:protein SHQ1